MRALNWYENWVGLPPARVEWFGTRGQEYYYNWNDLITPRNIRNSNNNDPDPNYEPKKKKRKYKCQIDYLSSLFTFYNWSNFKKSDYKYKAKDINELISINISEKSKELAALDHNNIIKEWADKNILNTYLIIYSDGSKLNKNNGTGIYCLNSKNSYAYNIGKYQEIFDSKFYRIYKALKIAKQKLNPFILEI